MILKIRQLFSSNIAIINVKQCQGIDHNNFLPESREKQLPKFSTFGCQVKYTFRYSGDIWAGNKIEK